jgi:acetolactate synthase-1/2/3 large subunit
MKLSDYIASFVAKAGANHVFLLPGGGCMHLMDSIAKEPGLEYIACLHEQACAYAAEAYAECRNHLGVVLVTSGPGGTNAVTGVATAWIESSGCLFLSGQAKRADMIGTRGVRSMGPQEVDLVSMVRPITKYAVSIQDPKSVRYHLEKAVFLATHGRPGPAWIEVPLDVQAAEIEPEKLVGFTPDVSERPASGPLREAVAKAIELLANAKRPVILAGNGIRLAHAEALFSDLLERINIPVLLTWKAIDLLPEDHRLFRGRPGSVGQRGANFTQQNADCILILGARLDLPSTAFDHQNFARAAKKIMVDIDPAEIWKMQMPVELPVCADAGDFLREFLSQSGSLKDSCQREWLDRTREWQVRYPVVLPEYRGGNAGFVSSYHFFEVLSEELEASDVILTGGSGAASDICMQTFKVKAGQRIFNIPGIGPMGSGLPAAIGGCIAAGRRRTICTEGDGGFQLNIQELETLRRLHLPVKLFVIGNDAYASIRSMQKNHFQGRVAAADSHSNLTLPNLGKIAAAYGIPSERIDSNAGLREGIRRVLATDGPVLCEVLVSPDEPTAPRVASVLGADGVLVTKPMEDMSPLLERQEFYGNMIIPPLGE